MTTQLRRTFVAALLVLSFVGLSVMAGSARQSAAGAQGQGASATQPSPAPSPAPRPEVKALTDAMALTDMSARVAAIEKIRVDFPQASNMAGIDNALLTTLVNSFPDRVDAINATLDRMVARIPAEAAPDARLQQLTGPVNILINKKVLLNRAESLTKDAVAALDPVKYGEALRDVDKRANRAERTQQQIDSSFNSLKFSGVQLLGRVYQAKGDTAKAEATFKEAIALAPAYGTSHIALVDIYTSKNDFASAEALLKDAIKAAPAPTAAARPQQALADVYMKKGDDAAAEEMLNKVLDATPTSNAALVPLARLEAKRGDAKALDHFMTAALGAQLKAEDEASMKALYAKAHNGNAAGLEEALDKAYLEKFPNPVKAEAYKPTPNRTNKLVLLELFTGSGCPPCVASDLAAEAVMDRYGDQIISLAYHEHIPQPDPMVAANNNDRRLYYSVSGVPTFEIDGSMIANAGGTNPGGGGRPNTAQVYLNYKESIDKALEMPAKASLNVKATGEGDQISVTVNVTALPADAKDLRLHIVLAEKELKFTGENGIRFHPMAVRATAGEKGAGLPITATGTTKYTFSLNQIKDEVTKSLAAELEKRRSGGATATYAADGHAYTAIDTSELVVVAFIQDGAYRAPKPDPTIARPGAPAGVAGAAPAASPQPLPTPNPVPAVPTTPNAKANVEYANVLNAAKTDVLFAGASKTKGGGR